MIGALARFLAVVAAYAAGVALVAALIAVWRDSDVADAVAIGLIAAGAILGLGGALLSAGPPAPRMPGLEREYVRHVEARKSSARREWWWESQARILTGVLLAAAGVLVQVFLT